MSKLTCIDLCSGIGGFSLGFRETGHYETVAFCEVDPWCRGILAQNFPGVPIFNDVRTFNYGKSADVICAGFPCQPFSTSGLRKGADDNRDIWPEVCRIVKEYRPTWFVGENVVGLSNMEFNRNPIEVESRRLTRFDTHDDYEIIFSRQAQMYLDRCCENLEEIGYSVQPIIVPACAVDSKQRRDRIWILANLDSSWQQQPGGDIPKSGERVSDNGPAIPNTSSPRSTARISGQDTGKEGNPKIPNNCDNGFGGWAKPSIWRPEPDMVRVVNGVSKRVDRLKGLGNAIVPQIATALGQYIHTAHLEYY